MTTPAVRGLVLASGSPRRCALLGEWGVRFDVVVSDVPETVDAGLSPARQAVALAERKAWAVASTVQNGLILGADTIVVLDNAILGKPAHDEDAVRMLGRLSGREHRVITGLALVDAASGVSRTSSVVSTVRLGALNDDEIERYVASGEPRDKAGAYAIQGLGAALIAGLDGCYTNVVGLPLCETASLLTAAGLVVSATPPVCRLPDGTPCPRLV
ncbi:MAG: Maf family protein [Thermomicrobiales bacterium]